MKYIIGLLTAGLLLFGCSKEGGKDHGDAHGMHEHPDDHTGHGHEGHEGHGQNDHSTVTGIMLNNGQKWIADKHTNDKVSQMKKEIADYKDSKDYAKLTTNLEADVNELIKGCTMDGEPHNQLHHWLEPLLGLVKGMKDANSDADKSAKVEELEKSLNQYTEYFK
ncbi:MAG: hypothetical protein CVV25_10860 [Ignavibacteriae bacterium HGW-Ignavibacteriae-4]|jgi:hypothetical protein|nr:MAG: hypothetical protein CVV25_10860 [Ignavibacteriae bacterium HGW-Ignavibacteriae-4]